VVPVQQATRTKKKGPPTAHDWDLWWIENFAEFVGFIRREKRGPLRKELQQRTEDFWLSIGKETPDPSTINKKYAELLKRLGRPLNRR
jgi:hypothetical protein